MFRHKNILVCKYSHTRTHTQTRNTHTLTLNHTCVVDIYLLSTALNTFPEAESATRGKTESSECSSSSSSTKVFPGCTRRKFLPFPVAPPRRRHFVANCVWNWIAIVNNSFPKIFPKLPSKLIQRESTSCSEWKVACNAIIKFIPPSFLPHSYLLRKLLPAQLRLIKISWELFTQAAQLIECKHGPQNDNSQFDGERRRRSRSRWSKSGRRSLNHFCCSHKIQWGAYNLFVFYVLTTNATLW